MRFAVVTIMPEMVTSAFQDGLVGQAIKKGLIHLETLNPRKFSEGAHNSVDDRVFGGSDGMLMQAEPLAKAVEVLRSKFKKVKVVNLSPRGRVFNDQAAKDFAADLNTDPDSILVLIASRYAGVDQRFIDLFCDDEISIGDYVLSGGELPACVVIDAIARKFPGVLGNAESSESDSFSEGLLECAQYTRPREWRGQEIPAVLLCGDPKLIEDWRYLHSLTVTAEKRPELLTTSLLKRVREIQGSARKGLGPSGQPAVRKAAFEDLSRLAEQVLAHWPK
jgi:tRNA (guanine37-N1)-methyltransferase